MSASPLSLKVSRSLYKGLQSFYNFESSGSLGADTFGANTLTASGSVSQVSGGVIGSAGHFASASSQFLWAPSGTFSFGSGYTIAAWVNYDTVTGQQDLIAKSLSTGNQRGYKLIKASASTFQMQHSPDGAVFTTVNSGITPVTGTWYCVIGWSDTVNVYVQVNNGAIVSHGITGTFQNSANFTLGGVAAEYLNGSLDLVGIWNRALTGYERALYYGLGAGLQLPFR